MVILLAIFIAGWTDVLPNPIDSLALIIVPPIIVITLIVTAGGLCDKKKKILRTYSTFVLFLCLVLSVYYLMYGGEQGGVGVFFIWFFAGLSAAIVYLVLIAFNFVQKYSHANTPNK
jgi:hypothetical protein